MSDACLTVPDSRQVSAIPRSRGSELTRDRDGGSKSTGNYHDTMKWIDKLLVVSYIRAFIRIAGRDFLPLLLCGH